jgi:hypothetical protein
VLGCSGPETCHIFNSIMHLAVFCCWLRSVQRSPEPPAASPGLPWLSLSPVRVRRLCHTGSPIMPHRSSLQAGKPVISHTGYLSLLLCTDPSHCLRLPHSLFFFFSALLTNPPGDQLDPPSLSLFQRHAVRPITDSFRTLFQLDF